MSLGSILRFICNFISEFVRFILFFASIIFTIVSVLLLVESIGNKQIYALIQVNNSDSFFYAIIGLAIYLIILSLFGLHGTFFRNKTSIEWFSLLASINVLIGLGVFMYSSPRLDDSILEVNTILQQSRDNYDWSASKGNSSTIMANATSKWDAVQERYQCCGLKGAVDWENSRPPSWPPKSYPVSCCKDEKRAIENNYICLSEMGVWENGCTYRVESINNFLTFLMIALTCFNLVLGFMGCIVILLRSNRPEYDVQ